MEKIPNNEWARVEDSLASTHIQSTSANIIIKAMIEKIKADNMSGLWIVNQIWVPNTFFSGKRLLLYLKQNEKNQVLN